LNAEELPEPALLVSVAVPDPERTVAVPAGYDTLYT
jgi:hypothetical protein